MSKKKAVKKAVKRAQKKAAKRTEREIAALTARVERAEAKTERWKERAKQSDAAARESAKELTKLRRRLEKALAAPAAAPAAAPVVEEEKAVEVGDVAEATGLAIAPATELATLEDAVQEAGRHVATTEDGPAGDRQVPDVTWTVTALRVAARDKGISGYSRRSKTELLRLLTE